MRFFASCLTLLIAFTPYTASAQTVAAPAPDLTGNACATDEAPLVQGGGGHNVVIVHNPNGADLVLRTSIDVNHIPGPSVAPLNCAAALNGSTGPLDTLACTGCQSIAVALQLNIIGRDVPRFGPRNVANAQNLRCDGCKAVAIAIQDTVQVDDPSQVPPRHDALVEAVGRKTDELHLAQGVSADEAAQHVLSALEDFNDLLADLDVQRSDAGS